MIYIYILIIYTVQHLSLSMLINVNMRICRAFAKMITLTQSSLLASYIFENKTRKMSLSLILSECSEMLSNIRHH